MVCGWHPAKTHNLRHPMRFSDFLRFQIEQKTVLSASLFPCLYSCYCSYFYHLLLLLLSLLLCACARACVRARVFSHYKAGCAQANHQDCWSLFFILDCCCNGFRQHFSLFLQVLAIFFLCFQHFCYLLFAPCMHPMTTGCSWYPGSLSLILQASC